MAVQLMTICLMVVMALTATSAGVLPGAAYVAPYASSYTAHVVNHAIAAPVAAPLVAAHAPVAAYSAYPYYNSAYAYSPYTAPLVLGK